MLQAIHDTLREEMRANPAVMVLGEDVGLSGGVFLATDGLQAEFGADRVLDTPLAEAGIIGVAIGLAVNGIRPVAEIQFADFIHPAFDQLVNEAARFRYRSGGEFGLPLVVRAPYGGGLRGGLYHSQSVEAFYCHVPGLVVVAPSTPADAAGLLRAALRHPDPVVFLEHKRIYRAIKGEVPADPDFTVRIGEARVARPGADISVFAYGAMLHQALEAAAAQEGEGLSLEVVDLRTLKPLDEEAICASVGRTSRALVVHEDNRAVGLGAEVAAVIAERAFWALEAPIGRVVGPDVPAVPFARSLEEAANFTARPEGLA
jgi:2-oxoisovalerate dehydrogenase E1 component beta subunit